jgi:heptosyltransferase I
LARTFALNICIFRLSALGDATHVLAVVDAIQKNPRSRDWKITWVIGPGEAKLVAGLKNVDLVIYDKKTGLRGALNLRQSLQSKLGGRPFDVLLQMQLALRANIVSRLIPAKRRIGFDRPRSKELHSLVINERIDKSAGPHVLDALFGFARKLGIEKPKRLTWPLYFSDADRDFAATHLPSGKRYLAISPCSSHTLRNWLPERYAAVANFASKSLQLTPVLLGGKSAVESQMADAIRSNLKVDYVDLVGKDTLKQLLAVLARADVLLSPDSGPAHMAQALGTPVVGLYAATALQRSGPYRSQQFCTDHYEKAAQIFKQKSASQLKWGQRVEYPGVMALIEVDEVCEKLRLASQQERLP